MQWRQVYIIYQDYQTNKGRWRRFFKVDSALMNAVRNLLAKAKLNSDLTLNDKLQLIKDIYKTLPKNSQRLSYQYAQDLVDLCIGQQNTGLFRVFKQLYNLDILNQKILMLLLPCEHKAFIAQQLDLIIKHPKFRNHSQQLKDVLKTNLAQSEAVECYIGSLWEHLAEWQAAVACYEKLLNVQQHAQAMYCLGRLYKQDQYQNRTIIIKRDQQKSLSFYKKAVLLGNQEAFTALQNEATYSSKAALYLAEIYVKGAAAHIAKNLNEALKWYKKASDNGNAMASFYLGQYYEQLAQSQPDNAYHYYAKAALQDHVEASHYLIKQANSGIAAAEYALGYHYYLPRKAIKQGVHWCNQAAKQQHSLALEYINKSKFDVSLLLTMAKAYEMGQELPQQLDTAVTFYKKAAQQNDLAAILRLAKLYEEGQLGFHKNLLQALAYYQQAVNLGFPPAILYQIGEEFEQDISTPKNKIKAMECYELAAEQKYLPALLHLINLYMLSDYEKTFKYCKQALLLGCQQVSPILQRLAKEGDDKLRNELSVLYCTVGSQAQASFWKKPISIVTRQIKEDPIQVTAIKALTQ